MFAKCNLYCRTSKSYDTSELIDELKNLLTKNGFEIVGDIENRGKFIYIKGLK